MNHEASIFHSYYFKKHYSKPNSSDILYIFVLCSINRHWHPESSLKHNIVDLYMSFNLFSGSNIENWLSIIATYWTEWHLLKFLWEFSWSEGSVASDPCAIVLLQGCLWVEVMLCSTCPTLGRGVTFWTLFQLNPRWQTVATLATLHGIHEEHSFLVQTLRTLVCLFILLKIFD